MQIQLKGWAAVPVVALALGFVCLRAVSASSSLDGQAGDEIKLHLRGVYASRHLTELREAHAEGRSDETERKIDDLMDIDSIELTPIGVKGSATDEIVVKCRVALAGEDPPDGKPIRYYRLSHQLGFGWKVRREVSAWHYYSKLF